MADDKGLVKRDRHSCSGNGALLVIIHSGSSYWEHSIVDETVLVALEHFGMPYRVLDLAYQRPTSDLLHSCAGIILAQNGLGGLLTRAETELICDTIHDGIGLVNLDYDLRLYQQPFLDMFGFQEINPYPYATNSLRVRDSDHYVTSMQSHGESHILDRMVTAIAVERWGKTVRPLVDGLLGRDQLIYIRHLAPGSAFEPRNWPLLFVAHCGQGRAVQFTLNMRVWRTSFYGHARGMDDLFWRSILWVVRKPFAANTIPPFLTLGIDDCSGRYELAYAGIARQHGYIPMPSLFLRLVPERLFAKIREGLESGTIEYNTHALDYYDLLLYHFGKGEYSSEELQERFSYADAWWNKVGAHPGCALRPHWGEYGANALPFLKERGYRFLTPALQVGLHKADQCMLDGYWPYGLQTRYYDYLPNDHGVFGFASMAARHHEDFLTGCTAYLNESEQNDVEKAAHSAAHQISQSLRSGFPAELVTHEQKFDALSLEEWDRILARIAALTEGYEKIPASHETIGRYLKGKDAVWISSAVQESDALHCTLSGMTNFPLRLSVFYDEQESVRREYVSVSPFEGKAHIG